MHPATTRATLGTRERILNAAEELASAEGASKLTLDAVAQSACVSKGGLLHHYPSKDALMVAMLERYCEQIDLRCERARAELADGDRANWLKSHILGLLHEDPMRPELGTALFAAAASSPALLDPIRMRSEKSIAQLVEHQCSFPRAAIVMLAIDGLMMGEVWRVTPFTADQREQVVIELLRLADEAFTNEAHMIIE